LQFNEDTLDATFKSSFGEVSLNDRNNIKNENVDIIDVDENSNESAQITKQNAKKKLKNTTKEYDKKFYKKITSNLPSTLPMISSTTINDYDDDTDDDDEEEEFGVYARKCTLKSFIKDTQYKEFIYNTINTRVKRINKIWHEWCLFINLLVHQEMLKNDDGVDEFPDLCDSNYLKTMYKYVSTLNSSTAKKEDYLIAIKTMYDSANLLELKEDHEFILTSYKQVNLPYLLSFSISCYNLFILFYIKYRNLERI
jgi:hypothetical protein